MDRPLLPIPSWKTRGVLCGLLVLPALIASIPWTLKLFSLMFIAVMTGTVRDWRVRGAEFRSQLFIAFVPLKPLRLKLAYVVQLETEMRKDVGMLDWILLAGFNWLMDRIMQWIWPWMAGEIELWLVTARDKRVLAWRGNGEESFQANLATLTSATGAPVRPV